MTRLPANKRMFKRAVVFSTVLHALLFTAIAISPSMTKPVQKGMIHYVSLGGFPGQGGAGGIGGSGGTGGGGGTGGSGGPKAAVLPPAKKETLRDLALPSKVKPEVKPSMTYPVDKPKKDKKGQDEKKAVITKSQPNLQGVSADKAVAAGSTTGEGSGGSGLRIGLGEGPGGGGLGGFGPGYGDQIGLSGFPYQYYLQIISDRVSSSWFTSLVDPGISGTFFATVYFKILRNGQVVDLKVKESSGIQSLDMSAQRAIQISAPFPPLPSDYEGDYLGIHLIFEHSR
jgi:TonB family protein